jgi:hypothetical protein
VRLLLRKRPHLTYRAALPWKHGPAGATVTVAHGWALDYDLYVAHVGTIVD